MIKFNKFNITNGADKAKVHYSIDSRIDKQQCVTIYAKDYDRSLGRVFKNDYVNDSDPMSDYFDKGRVVLFTDHPLYAPARARAEQNVSEQRIKQEQRTNQY